jgi:hypothetical protein
MSLIEIHDGKGKDASMPKHRDLQGYRRREEKAPRIP